MVLIMRLPEWGGGVGNEGGGCLSRAMFVVLFKSRWCWGSDFVLVKDKIM